MLLGTENDLNETNTLVERGSIMTPLEANLGLACKFVLDRFHPPGPVEDTEEYSVACEGLMRACETYREELGEFSTYAYRCMRNAVFSELKRRKRRPTTEFHDPSSFDSIVEKENRNTEKEAIDEAMKFLLVSDKMDIEMLQDHYVKEMKLREIAQKYGVTKMRVSQRIHRAIEKIKTKIKQ